ncbi:hypothetical protein L7F22_036477 [Adiantum nelumboides]|nr:hypothetical protein [Adiantum nelumboides]
MGLPSSVCPALAVASRPSRSRHRTAPRPARPTSPTTTSRCPRGTSSAKTVWYPDYSVQLQPRALGHVLLDDSGGTRHVRAGHALGNQRKAFGKPLNGQAAVRQKLAQCISLAEAAQNWLESVTYQMCNMSYKQQSLFLAGQVALLKSWSTRVSHEVADASVQLFGGRGLTKSGMGRFAEEFHRTYKFDAVLGGSEEILADLGIRQALRFMPQDQKL